MRQTFGLFQRAVEAIYPATCPVCRTELSLAQTLCPDCWPRVSFLERGGCRACARPLPGVIASDLHVCDDCLRLSPAWQEGRAAVRYEGAGRRLVLGLKHGDRHDLVPMLADWMLRVGDDLVAGADLIAPVPLHWTRRLRRGANQAAVLARTICQRSGRKRAFAPRLLVRQRKTGSQDGKDRAARKANVAGAFALGPGPQHLGGRRILLIDDVYTTGATLDETARVCMAAGASRIDILVLALVISDERPYISPPIEDEDHETS